MSNNIDNSLIKDNTLIIEGNSYTGLEVQKIIVGVENPTQREILVDKTTGFNYSRNLVEAKELYNVRKKKHIPCFMLDLETGQHGWYPGCEIHGDIPEGIFAEIKQGPLETADTLQTISKATVTILEIETIDQEPIDKGWYKILYDVEGYIKKEFITNLRYADPNRI
jgi:hypothetical protein